MAAAATSGDAPLKTALMLLRRTDPEAVQDNAEALSALVEEDVADELMQRVDLPLQIVRDASTGKDFLATEFNADGDAYRSPWSNKFFPEEEAEEGAVVPTGPLRKLEEHANALFDAYRQQYYNKAASISSVYVWGVDNGFAAAFMVRRKADAGKFITSGSWESTHVLGATKASEGKYTLQLTSSVSLHMQVDSADTGNVSLGGSLTRQGKKTAVVDVEDPAGVMAVVGPMVEAMEGSIRNSLDQVYLSRSRTIVQSIRNGGDPRYEAKLSEELKKAAADAQL